VYPQAQSRAVQARFAITLVLFLLSGATGLIDQLCFSKYLTYVVGSTAHAVSAVLAAFMAGLAIGAHFGGKLALTVRRPLAAYGVLELLVALTVALCPFAFRALTPAYVALAQALPDSLAVVSALRWLLAMIVVIVPTTAMGATLPLLSRAVGLSDQTAGETPRVRERRLAALYAINTLGGGLGALLSAYAVLPALGLKNTLFASAALSALIGVLAFVLDRAPQEAVPSSKPDSEAPPQPVADVISAPAAAQGWVLVALAFASGWLVFACEVVFTHVLAVIIGNSAYAFGLILAIFLLCLCLGASQAQRLHRRLAADALPLSLAVTGLMLALTLPLWDRMPLIFAGSGKVVESFVGREAVRALVAFTVLFVPTTLMGLTFPLLLQRVATFPRAPQWVGRLVAVNTLGAVVGALLTGYAILPRLGSQNTLIAVALIFAGAALTTPRTQKGVARRGLMVLCAATGFVAVLMPRWDPARLTLGANVYFEAELKPAQVLMVREDVHGGVTTVVEREGVRTLYTNGKFQGNTGWEMSAQRFFAHYPSLFVSHFGRALVVGLGTGTTLGTVNAYPWREIDVVEISPAIAEAARTYFGHVNRHALDDRRVRLIHADGRNYMLLSKRRYDLISMELSSIWFAGASNLYSREYYKLVKDNLAPGGIFEQWVQLHHIRRRDFGTILHTLRLEFPHVALFLGGGQGIIVASMSPLRASQARTAELESQPAFLETVPQKRPLMTLFDDLLVENQGLDRFLEETAARSGVRLSELISTDDNLYLEYATPRGNVLPWSAREALVAELKRFRDETAPSRMIAP
jgi:spermidine synthase